MPRYMKLINCFVIIGSIMFTGLLFADEVPESVNSKQLIISGVADTMNEPIVKGKSLIYCGAFQMAWNMLIEDVIDQSFKVEGEPDSFKAFNEKLVSKREISDKDYLAIAGFKEEGIIRRFNKLFKEKYNTSPTVNTTMENPSDLFIYSYFFKEIKFPVEFENLEDDQVMFNGFSSVPTFGIESYSFDEKHLELAKQISVAEYTSEKDFIVVLKPASENEELVLAKVPPQKTMLETVTSVMKRVKKSQPIALAKNDTLQIPKIDFNLDHSLPDYEGKYVSSTTLKNPFIAKAAQDIRFKLADNGPLLKEDSGVAAIGMSEQGKLKKLIFDKPFLLYLKTKEGSYPYFVMWVDNSELFSKE